MRIVSLLPGATEIICALGLTDHLVAVSHECDTPESVKSLPKATRSNIPAELSPAEVDGEVVQAVTEGKALYEVDRDLLASLRPDLIVTQGVCDVCAVNTQTLQETVKQLPARDAASIELVSLEGKSFDQILADIERVARATQTEAAAKLLLADLRQRWQALRSRPRPQKPRVLALEWPDPPYFGGHWVPEMIEAAGGIDCMGRLGMDSSRCTWEAISAQDPDVILLIACGFDLAQNAELGRDLYRQAPFARLRAAQTQQVWAFDANALFSRPGPRIVDGAETLERVFSNEQDEIAHALRVTCE